MQRLLLLLFPCLLLTGCDPTGSDDDGTPSDNFDRAALLEGWMDDVVIPAQSDLNRHLDQLVASLEAMENIHESAGLQEARATFQVAYLSWQRYSPFVLVEGEAVRLRERTNTYPSNVPTILANLNSPDVNLELPSNTAAQGFPALDYLLFEYSNQPANGSDQEALAYAVKVARALQHIHAEVETQLIQNRDAYVANTSNSVTGSIDRTVNDFIFHYEKFLRAGKVGIPAGVFSDDPLPGHVESRFGNRSKSYFLEAVATSEDFFNNHGLADYLDALNVSHRGELLSATIANQFTSIRATAAPLNEDFEQQLADDPTAMLRLYDELQKLTILLKVDMLQALSINVDYVDADGD